MNEASAATDAVVLTIDGAVGRARAWTLGELLALPGEAIVKDVSQVDPRRSGTAVRLAALLEQTELSPAATHLTLHASSDGFAATVPIEAVRQSGLLIVALDGQPLPDQAGGPSRFLVPDAAACGTAEVDACKNVKFVDRVEVVGER
ncbi:MAG: molybdopterin-dependent oxidoreductase [Maioricimonas sp. JB045]